MTSLRKCSVGTFLFAVFCCSYSGIAATVDPCKTYSRLPRAEYRGGQCQYVYGKEVCDSTLAYKWYRAVGLNGSDLEIQTMPASFGRCGTKFPYWMNGTHPTVGEGEVSRAVCLVNNADCDSTMDIQVKNCSGFYVYHLRKTLGCPNGYCFGSSKPCPPLDPCDVFGYSKIPYDKERSSVCNIQSGTCDAVNDTLWYKFESSAGSLNLSSTCPSGSDGCGSSMSIWINSTRLLGNGTEELTVCTKDKHDCCNTSHTILSKQCNSFRVYNFGGLPLTPCQRFCTDDATAMCPATTPATENVTHTTHPTHTENNSSETHTKNSANACHFIFSIITIAQLISRLITHTGF